MKKRNFFAAIIAMVIIFASCTKSEITPGEPNPYYYGTAFWKELGIDTSKSHMARMVMANNDTLWGKLTWESIESVHHPYDPNPTYNCVNIGYGENESDVTQDTVFRNTKMWLGPENTDVRTDSKIQNINVTYGSVSRKYGAERQFLYIDSIKVESLIIF